jgi:FkbM family methyltransferase
MSTSLRSLVGSIAPAPVKRLARTMMVWKRRAQFRPYVMSKSVRGDNFPFYIGDATAQAWYGGGNNRSPELGFIRDQMLAHGDLVFDVGSHHGLFAVAMARRSACVVAIEPNPHNLAILRRNVGLNQLENVRVRPVAVGDRAGHIKLRQESLDGGVLFANREGLATTDVQVMPLDILAAEHGFPQLIKIDVEGFECQALRGAAQILSRLPKIAIEVHVSWIARYGSSVKELLDLLHLERYSVWVMPHPRPEIRPWAGEDLTAYPPPKFNLFLLPRQTHENQARENEQARENVERALNRTDLSQRD